MTTYSVADAKNGLPRLIDRALEGEEVIISRHGKAVAELRSIAREDQKVSTASYMWLKARRLKRDLDEHEVLELHRPVFEASFGGQATMVG